MQVGGRVAEIVGGATPCTSDYLRFLRTILQRGVFNGRRVLSAIQ
jgi:hypothetical protein